MEFDKTKVFTSLNADELKAGSEILAADNLFDLKSLVKNYENIEDKLTLDKVLPETCEKRFIITMVDGGENGIRAFEAFPIVYLISEPKKYRHEDVIDYLDLEKHLSETYVKELRELNFKYEKDFNKRAAFKQEISDWFLEYFNLAEEEWDTYDLDFDFLQEEGILLGKWIHRDYEDYYCEFCKVEIPKRLVLTSLSAEEVERCIIRNDDSEDEAADEITD